MITSLASKYTVERDLPLERNRIVLPINAPVGGRAPLFIAAKRSAYHDRQLSLGAKFFFYLAATAFGSWLAFGVAWKGF